MSQQFLLNWLRLTERFLLSGCGPHGLQRLARPENRHEAGRDFLRPLWLHLAGVREPCRVSSDGGTSFAVPPPRLAGHVGAGVALGRNKKIAWNAGADWNNQLSNTVKFRVTACDTSDGLALIPAVDILL